MAASDTQGLHPFAVPMLVRAGLSEGMQGDVLHTQQPKWPPNVVLFPQSFPIPAVVLCSTFITLLTSLPLDSSLNHVWIWCPCPSQGSHLSCPSRTPVAASLPSATQQGMGLIHFCAEFLLICLEFWCRFPAWSSVLDTLGLCLWPEREELLDPAQVSAAGRWMDAGVSQLPNAAPAVLWVSAFHGLGH